MLLTRQDERIRRLRQTMLFRALIDPTIAEYPSLSRMSDLVPGLSLFGSISPGLYCAGGNPFLTLNSRRVASALQVAPHSATLPRTVSGFLLSAFDEFFPSIPVGSSIAIELEGKVVLPQLNVCFGNQSQSVKSIAKISDSEILINANHHQFNIDLSDINSSFELNTSLLRNLSAGKVLGTRSYLLFEDAYFDDVAEARESVEVVRELVDGAIELIRIAGTSHVASIESILRWVVPINFDDPSVHRSFTSPSLSGVIFVSSNTTSLGMAEAVIHETAHSELNMLMDIEQLFEGDPKLNEPVFYSPWRPEPRPFSGLFHGTYVFGKVLQFLSDLAETCPRLRTTALERGRIIAYRLGLSLPQIHNEYLCGRGHDLRSEIQAAAKTFLRIYYPFETRPPYEIMSHLGKWVSLHPTLAKEILVSTDGEFRELAALAQRKCALS